MFEEAFKREEIFLVRKINLKGQSYESRMICNDFDEDNYAKIWTQNHLLGKKIKYLPKRNLNIVDFCCSVGGLSLGAFEAAKSLQFNPNSLFAVDIDKSALATYSANFNPKIKKNISISKLIDFSLSPLSENNLYSYPPEILDKDLKKLIGQVDLFISGPPCQGHSNLNNKSRKNDPRNNLYLDVVTIAITLKSKTIVIENVHGVINDNKNVIDYAKKIFNSNGYEIIEKVINADDVGGGQTRKRHFLIASLNPALDPGIIIKSFNRPKITVGDLIGLKPINISNEQLINIPSYSKKNIERINYLFDNNLYDLPNHVRPDCHKNGHSRPAVYGRLSWDKPSPTITTGFMSPGRGRYIHPKERRCLNPHEAARIQGFPDTFMFIDFTPTKIAKWIGDAVPFSLAYVASLSAITALI